MFDFQFKTSTISELTDPPSTLLLLKLVHCYLPFTHFYYKKKALICLAPFLYHCLDSLY